MKTLQESLFDKDIVKTNKGVGFRLQDQAFYDGEWLRRLKGNYDFDIRADLPGATHALGIINWKKVRADLKKYGGDDIDLGDYAYYNSDKYKVHNATTKPKTEAFARLILSIPTTEECHFDAYNSRFRDEMCGKLNEYIVEEKKDIYTFDVETKFKDLQLDVVLRIKNDRVRNRDLDLCRWEFLKLNE
jgi:hypothetical protein